MHDTDLRHGTLHTVDGRSVAVGGDVHATNRVRGGGLMRKDDVIKIIDEVMNNREIDSIRNAILAIRDKVIEEFEDDTDDWTKDYVARLKLRGNNRLYHFGDYFDGAKYVCIDTMAKVDTGIYGGIWYE